MKRLIPVLLAALLLFCGCGVMNYDTYEDKGYKEATGTVAADGVDAVEINWVSGRIVIEETDSDRITFTEKVLSDKKTDALGSAMKNKELSESLRMRYRITDGKLCIQFCKSGLRVRIGAVSDLFKELTVSVPRGTALRSADINTVSSDVSLTGLKIGSVKLKGVSAALSVRDCETSGIRCETVSGRVDISSSVLIDDITVKSVSGSVSASLPGVVKFSAEGVSANVSLEVEKADFTLDLDGITTNFDASGLDYSKDGDGKYKFGEGTGSAKIESVSGKVTVKKK